MLTFLDNRPIFVLQPLRGKTVSHCGEIYNLWYAEELSLGPQTVLQIHCGSSALLISPHTAETCLFQHSFFSVCWDELYENQLHPDTSDASWWSVLGPILSRILVNILHNKMECTQVDVDGLKLGGVEGVWKHYGSAIQR